MGCGGVEQRALYWKQLQLAGVRMWNADDIHDDPHVATDQARIHIKVYLFISDQGPDQTGNDKLMHGEVSAMPLVLLFRQWCMRHNAHLMSKKGLARLKHGLYWRDLAKIVNSWRGHGN